MPASVRPVLIVALLALVAGACGAPAGEAREASRPARIGDFAHFEAEVRLRRVEHVAVPSGRTIDTRGIAAGGAQIAILTVNPPAPILAEHVNWPTYAPETGGAIDPTTGDAAGDGPVLGWPTEVVGVTPSGAALYLDLVRGRVVSETNGMTRAVTAVVEPERRPRDGCAVRGRDLAYIDDRQLGTVFLHTLTDTGHSRTLPGPPELARMRGRAWSELHLSGAFNGPCALWGPRLPTAYVVTHDGVRALGPFVEADRGSLLGGGALSRDDGAPDAGAADRLDARSALRAPPGRRQRLPRVVHPPGEHPRPHAAARAAGDDGDDAGADGIEVKP